MEQHANPSSMSSGSSSAGDDRQMSSETVGQQGRRNTMDAEADISFGEPLHVSVTRATSRFKSIQRTFSMSKSVADEEESTGVAEAGNPGGFDLTTWLSGRQQLQGPPFAKRIGLVFDDLDVYGDNVANRHIETMITPFYKIVKSAAHGFGIKKLFNRGNDNKKILNKMSGLVEDGEMLLVLGQPGAGCSTLLRVLGNRRGTYRKIEGQVSYGGLTPEEVEKRYRGEVAYNQEDDVHFPTLTVRKTLDFAIKCKTPSKRMLADREGYEKEFLDTLLDMYGLSGCADTIVGNAFLRGVSGGERKRVSIAEQVASGASIDIWDGSTRGLDSSSALDYVRSLRITTDVLQKSTIVTIYQASENIYELFDKVMVIDQGRELYFGPANKAVEYFASIGIYKPPRQTTSDFLTGVTQLHERTVLPGWEDKAPKTAEDFERSWLESQEYRTLKGDIQRFEQRIETDNRSAEIRDFVDQTKMGTEKSKLRRKSPYTTTFTYQLGKLFKREWEIMMGSIGQQIFKIAYNAAFAIIVGTLFLSLPETTMGAFTRGGVLFFALLFNSLSAQAELPKAITGREVVYKHKSFAMYHPAALSLAQTVVDIPIMVLQIVIFSCILYFATGLSRTAGQFFAFVLFLFIGCLCLTAFFRLIGNVSPNVDVAHTLSGISLLFMILHIGYLIPQKSMHGYLVWIYWANSLAYAYKALMANEFRNLKLKCGGPQLFPQIPGVGIDNQVCTLQGAVPGQDYVLGRDHIEVGYSFIVDDMWKDFGAVVGFWLLYVILIAVVMEYVEFGNTGYSINVYKRRRPKVNLYTEKDGESNHGVDTFGKVASSGPTDEQILAGTAFTWKNVNYAVPVKGGNKQLLDDVSGYIKPGTMTALMGSSGAGKTTLLDSLSQRKTIGTLDGEILMNGAPQPASFRRITGYCEQLDVHNPHSTVREALRFSAYLRQSASVSDEEKNDYVEHVIYLLGMTDIADCMIGLPESGEGISLEERKRLTIGVELVAKPKILFLDEPTSGLDAQASFTIVTFLRRLAAEGQTILCTIHQPSSMLFEQFDRLLLLVRGGHTVYFGDIGHDAQTLINYFERNGGPKCPPSANPAEYILDVVGSRNATVDWPQTWSDSKEKTTILGEIDRINELEHLHGNDQVSEDDKNMFARDYWYQIKLVTKRMFRSYWRDLEYSLTRVALQVVSAIVIGIAFLRLSTSATDLQNKVFALFQTAIISILIINQVQPQFLRQRLYYGREASSNQYGWRAFSAAIIVTEWPFSIFANTIYFVIMYWLVGLNTGSDRIGYFYIMYVVLGIFSITLGQAIASFSPNDIIAAMLNPIFTSMVILFCGVTIPYAMMPKFWRFVYRVSPFTYFLEGTLTNDLHGAEVRCRDEELYSFKPLSGMSCGEYAGAYVKATIGYLNNPNATANCQYCPYKVGDDYYAALSWNFDHRWRNFGLLFAYLAFNIAFTTLMIKIYKVNKR